MHAHPLPQPGLIWGLYPEKRIPASASSPSQRLTALINHLGRPGLRRYTAIATESKTIERTLRGLNNDEFGASVQRLKHDLVRSGLSPALTARAFAVIGETCRRHLGMSPYATQRIAAAIMLDNRLAEMATGEGKTLAAALVAATGALAGIPVHVLTANDYLVARDAAKLEPVYAALGLSVGTVQQQQNSEQRRSEYACDITYCTAKELVFDYLRDLPLRNPHRSELSWRAAQFKAPTQAGSGTLLRGLCMAVIDEADSILIDEARVPLIISELRDQPGKAQASAELLQLALNLQVGEDYVLNYKSLSATLTDKGRSALQAQAESLHPVWRNRRHGEENLCLALAALHLFRRDRHYLVREGAVHIIDETTGRLAPGRTWSRGLHQFIELKEICKPSSETITRTQITYQRFFPRYLRLCGMSGTLAESRSELARVFGLPVVRVPLRLPSRRAGLGHRVFLQRQQQWHVVQERATELSRSGRPVLIGTDSVADSESLSAYLTQYGLPHTVLNARNDKQEAEIVALAGLTGRITIATNMAGRGTDIPLDPQVAECGGLHVISCQMNSARRIDRQLQGRCARQGDPGSVETLLALDAPLIARGLPAWLHTLAQQLARTQDGRLPAWFGKFITTLVQRLEESHHQVQRAMLLHHDQQLDRQPMFRE
jgi:preprotein translocase subunit SecA